MISMNIEKLSSFIYTLKLFLGTMNSNRLFESNLQRAETIWRDFFFFFASILYFVKKKKKTKC